MNTVNIIGAGLSGLIAANMLQRHRPSIWEKSAYLPNNHSAVLRFRTSVVADAVGIPFKKVRMIKFSHPWRNPVADSLSYANKIGGIYRSDRSISSAQVSVAERFIAPKNFIQQLSSGLDIILGANFEDVHQRDFTTPAISTIPLPRLAEILNYPFAREIGQSAAYASGYNIKAKVIDCEAYATVYVPQPSDPFTRISVTGDELIVETIKGTQPTEHEARAIVARAIEIIGISQSRIPPALISASKQTYAKILPMDEKARKEFIHWATVNHNIYSLGRFATWRPGLLLDDLVQDVHLINSWIRNGVSYDVARHNKQEAAE